MKVIFLNVLENALPVVLDIENNNEVFYKYLQCDAIDVAFLKFNGKSYIVICDDMGYSREGNLKVALFQKENKGYPIVGNVIISKTDTFGELTDLSEDDVKNVFSTLEFFVRRINDEDYELCTSFMYD